jgi:hypothetical protein
VRVRFEAGIHVIAQVGRERYARQQQRRRMTTRAI